MDTQTRPPAMGWIGVATNVGAIYCWPCATRLKHVGLMLKDSDVWLADDQCDRCGCTILTGEHPPPPDVTRQLVEAGCHVAEMEIENNTFVEMSGASLPGIHEMPSMNPTSYEKPVMNPAALIAALGASIVVLGLALIIWLIGEALMG